MVKLKKQISIILVLSFFLSLIPNFLYNESREILASEPCEDDSCPQEKFFFCDSDPVYDERSETCVCTNCSVYCPWEKTGETTVNKSCLPLEGTGEWGCGVEIPIGEVVDGTSFLAEKMLVETLGIIKGGEEMVTWTDRFLTDYKKWGCEGFENWEGKEAEETRCKTKCRKHYQITAGTLQPAQSDPECSPEISQGKAIFPEDCNADYTQCEYCTVYCADVNHKEECCWIDSSQPNPSYDPDYPEREKEYLSCKYCKKGDEGETKYCYEYCSVWTCSGCCGQYFAPIFEGLRAITSFQEELKNDIDEEYTEEEEQKDLPADFKLKRSYILKQLEFSRCELAQCWISAEEYPDVFAGEKVGKHLLTCEAVNQLEFLDEDQINCLSAQIKGEWEDIEAMWKEPKENWWKWLIAPFYIQGKTWKMGWMTIWGMIKERSDTGQEEGCYPHNYYCCQK